MKATSPDSRLRRFDPRRDVESLVDLVTIAFAGALDPASRAMLEEMRRAARPSSVPWRAGWLAWSGVGVTPGFVWEVDGRIVGNVSLRRSATRGGFFVGNLAVHPEWRRKRVAAQLMDAALDEIIKLGGRWIGLEVRAGNEPARALYERFSFQEVGSTKHLVRTARHEWETRQTDHPLLRRGRARDMRPLLDLMCRIIPAGHRALLELGSRRYDPGWQRTLDHWLAGQRQAWWLVEEDGAIRGAVRALRDWGRRPDQLDLLIAPEAAGRFEGLLVGRGMASLSGSRAKIVGTVLVPPAELLIASLKAAGFFEAATLSQMRLDLSPAVRRGVRK
ncbi:MAG: GNAT family N-acetyltransferase [Anaerolineales bacterium]|nr:MAG: GNAT family N-acetyltransferase [Anaerolineales bacterium]